MTAAQGASSYKVINIESNDKKNVIDILFEGGDKEQIHEQSA